jgi:HD-like signal output (HDOD) protein
MRAAWVRRTPFGCHWRHGAAGNGSRGVAWLGKPRAQLTAAELETLYEQIDRKLDRVGIETQPEVAARVLEMSADPDAGVKNYAKVLSADMAMTGRLLRVANSSYFAQRQPVTNIDRACVVLGLERIKAIALGFYLSRAAASDAAQRVSRQTWGQSVFRATLACEIGRHLELEIASEAFVVGLMLDAGIPLLFKMLGEPYGRVLELPGGPGAHFKAEFEQLPFTHVDVVTALVRRWKLPELLARPIELHHTAPADVRRPEPSHALHRIAFYVGAVGLTGRGTPADLVPLPALASRHLGIDAPELECIFQRAVREYDEVWRIFSQVAESIGDLASLADLVHNRLIATLDQSVAATLPTVAEGPHRFRLGGREVEIVTGQGPEAVAYVNDSRGQRLISHHFIPLKETTTGLIDALGLQAEPGDQVGELDQLLRSLAA